MVKSRGILLNLSSAFAFYLATALLRLGIKDSSVSSEFYASVRYAIGFAIALFLVRRWKSTLWLPDMRFIFFRSIFNVAAVICFYRSVATGQAGPANVLNMTYPVFVVLLAVPLLKEPLTWNIYALAALCATGIIIHALGNLAASANGAAVLWGTASGVLAALAIISLRGAATQASAEVILVWMFGLGCLILLPVALPEWKSANARVWFFAGGSALAGVAGQFLLTLSYRELRATTGSMISSARIPIALTSGYFFLEEPFTASSWIGAGCILLSNIALALLPKAK